MLEENKFKRSIRNSLAALLAYFLILSGAVKKAKKQCLEQEKVLSAFFHDPPEKIFKACILWLVKNGFVFISTGQLLEFLYQKKPLPAGAVWITFDDGWDRNLSQVIPVIREMDVPVTFFIPTAEIEKGAFWFNQVIKHKKRLPPEFRTRPFEKLLVLKNSERLKIVQDLYPESGESGDPMSIADIREIAALPQVTIGSHTVNHVVTVNCEPGELEQEIKNSKAALEQWLGKEIISFAYPNGDHDGREKPLLQKHGYKIAATIENEYITADTDPFFVPRNCVLDDGSFAENLCHMLGVWTPFIEKLKKFFGR